MFSYAVVPFVHSGMDQVLPKGSALPRPGQSIRVLVGEPIAVADLQQMAAAEQWPEHVVYAAIADRIGHSLHALKARLEGVPVSEVRPSEAFLLHDSPADVRQDPGPILRC